MDGASSASTRGKTAAVLLALPLVLSACTGGDPGDTPAPSGSGPVASSQAPSSSAAPSPSPTGDPEASSAPPPLTGPLPSFTAEALRRRLAIMVDHSLEALVFRSREGTPLTTANVRRQLRKVLGEAGIEGVSPHMFRCTVATVINEQASLNLASELLGHTDPKVTIEHYIRRNEQVNPLTAELLDQVFAREDDGSA